MCAAAGNRVFPYGLKPIPMGCGDQRLGRVAVAISFRRLAALKVAKQQLGPLGPRSPAGRGDVVEGAGCEAAIRPTRRSPANSTEA